MFQRIETAYKKVRRIFSRSEWLVRLLGLDRHNNSLLNNKEYAAHPVGLILVQIDGLGHDQLKQAIDSGELPFIRRLLNKEHYQCLPLYSGLPSSTPAVQGELFYGVKNIVPSFAFRRKADGRQTRMVEPAAAHRIQKELEARGTALLKNGSAYCDIYTGGARESHFCAASSGWNTLFSWSAVRHWGIVLLLNIPTLVKVVALMVIEILLAVKDLFKGIIDGKSAIAEMKSLVARVMVSILLRDLVTIGATVDIARGLPVIHLNYLGYDEQSHRRGPDSPFAHWTLKGIDKCIEKLWRASHHNIHRHYDLWVYSDHGQERTTPYTRLTGNTINSAVAFAYDDILRKHQPTTTRVSRNSLTEEQLNSGNACYEKLDVSGTNSSQPGKTAHSPVTIAIGPVGHVYIDNKRALSLRSDIASQLVLHYKVPAAVLMCSDRLEVHMAAGVSYLPGDGNRVFGACHPFLKELSSDLLEMCRHVDAGDIVLLGCVNGVESVSFKTENGAHAGIGPNETKAFALIPADTDLSDDKKDYIRPAVLHRAGLRILSPQSQKISVSAGADKIPKADITHQNHSLKVMTYNVHSCIGMDNIASPERIARVISRYRPDIIALQELDVNRTRSNNIHQASLIAEMLDMDFYFHPSISEAHEEYGDAIISRFPMQLRKAAALPKPTSMIDIETRGALWVTVDYFGDKLQIFNTHLGLRNKERLLQTEALLGDQWLHHPDCIGPSILCGDLNAVASSRVVQRFSPEFTDVQTHLPRNMRKKTFSSRVPTVQIDYILANENFKTHSVEVLDSELTRVASDHLPMMASLTLQ